MTVFSQNMTILPFAVVCCLELFYIRLIPQFGHYAAFPQASEFGHVTTCVNVKIIIRIRLIFIHSESTLSDFERTKEMIWKTAIYAL